MLLIVVAGIVVATIALRWLSNHVPFPVKTMRVLAFFVFSASIEFLALDWYDDAQSIIDLYYNYSFVMEQSAFNHLARYDYSTVVWTLFPLVSLIICLRSRKPSSVRGAFFYSCFIAYIYSIFAFDGTSYVSATSSRHLHWIFVPLYLAPVTVIVLITVKACNVLSNWQTRRNMLSDTGEGVNNG